MAAACGVDVARENLHAQPGLVTFGKDQNVAGQSTPFDRYRSPRRAEISNSAADWLLWQSGAVLHCVAVAMHSSRQDRQCLRRRRLDGSGWTVSAVQLGGYPLDTAVSAAGGT